MNEDFEKKLSESGEVGFVVRSVSGVVEVEGLPGVKLGEKLMFESGQMGQVTKLGEGGVEVLVLANKAVRVGTRVARSGAKVSVGLGEGMLGKTVDALGRVIWGGDDVSWSEERVIDQTPLGMVGRKKISRPLESGVIMIDQMIPIGKGQRELVMGDRKTGKSYVLWQVILGQARLGSVCVYAAVGKKKAEIARAREFFESKGVAGKVVIVAASLEDSPGEIFLSPYTAMTVAEFFRDKGRDVLLVLDDMTTHAKFYRELSLLSRKFPGRDSYPGDIFHVHSKLLERGGNFQVKVQGGDGAGGEEKEAAITSFVVVETVQGDVTGYIQTNLMSMTDGHIYFDNDLYFKGRRPAINPFISVTRVGHQTQTELGRDVGRVLFDLLNNYEKTQGFLRFGAELGENSRQILAMGDKVLEFFNQPPYSRVPTAVGVVMLALLLSGLWEGKNMDKVLAAYDQDEGVRQVMDELAAGSGNVTALIEKARGRVNELMPKIS